MRCCVLKVCSASEGRLKETKGLCDERKSVVLIRNRKQGEFAMSNEQQQKMINLWEEHVRYEFEDHDVESTIATMIEGAHIQNIPTMAGGDGLDEVREFYQNSFVFNLPEDTETVLISRTVGDVQIVDELVFKFTHSIEMPWMLPGVAPTGKRVEVPLVVILSVKEGKVASEHIHWDQASVLAQVGLIDASKLPVVGAESARKLEARLK